MQISPLVFTGSIQMKSVLYTILMQKGTSQSGRVHMGCGCDNTELS
jgi:hypothetical protein